MPFLAVLFVSLMLQDPAPVASAPDNAQLDALKERSEYADLDQRAVQRLARSAEDRWPEELSGFRYLRVERFSAGGAAQWMSIWSHGKTGLEFVLVPGGEFQMGSPASEADRGEDESQHGVTLGPFLAARTECTWDAWFQVEGAKARAGDLLEDPGQLPVRGFSPMEVEAWCREAGLALPTEAQWEFACRAGTITAWTMGAHKDDLSRFGNVGSAECPEDWVRMGITEAWLDGYGTRPAEVGSFACNAFGLFDVHGNLCEWVADAYASYEVPTERGTGRRLGTSGGRIARGGNFGGAAAHARSAHRLDVGSGVSPGANKGFGFRPVLDLAF